MNDFPPEQMAVIEAAVQQHLEACRSRSALLTDERLLELANTTGLLAGIRLAAACHPDRVTLVESTAPANAALLRFARAVLSEANL